MAGLDPRLSGWVSCTPAASHDWPQAHLGSSSPGLTRRSTPLDATKKDMDARDKPGHRDSGLLNRCLATTDSVRPDSRGPSPAMTAERGGRVNFGSSKSNPIR